MTRIRSSLFVVVPLLVLLAFGCSRPPAPEFRLNATIKDLMDAIMDPNADALWESVVVEATLAGVTKKEPKTDDDWKALKRSAIALTEISNLLLMEGRRVAKPGEKAEDERVDLNPDEIEARINADRAAWTKLAHGLQDAAIVNLRAIEARDLEKFLEAGETLDKACESCHRQYWYRVPPPIDALAP